MAGAIRDLCCVILKDPRAVVRRAVGCDADSDARRVRAFGSSRKIARYQLLYIFVSLPRHTFPFSLLPEAGETGGYTQARKLNSPENARWFSYKRVNKGGSKFTKCNKFRKDFMQKLKYKKRSCNKKERQIVVVEDFKLHKLYVCNFRRYQVYDISFLTILIFN